MVKHTKQKIILLAFLVGTFCVSCGREPVQRLKFGYVTKGLEYDWFQMQKNGMEAKCSELGIELECFDADFDDDVCLEMVRSVIDEGCDALMICPTNQELGPEIGKMCEKAGIPVVTLDDSMVNESGRTYPHIGMPTKEVGALGGVALGKLAEEKGFFEEGNVVKILELDVPQLSVIRERLDGYEESLLMNTNLKREDIVVIDVPDGMYKKNMEASEKFFSDHPYREVTHWIICGANDETATAAMHVLKKRGADMENVIACGLGAGELSIAEFEVGNSNYIATMLQPDMEGSKAVEMLYKYLEKGEPLPETTLMGGKIATSDNYMIFYNYSNLTNP